MKNGEDEHPDPKRDLRVCDACYKDERKTEKEKESKDG
jgi:hypothetical protein